MDDYWYPDWDFYVDTHDVLIQQYGGFSGFEYESQWFKKASLALFQEIIKQVRDCDGDIIKKSALMLVRLTRSRIWADGQKRTAYITTKTFMEENGATMAEDDSVIVDKFLRNLTFKYSHDQVEKWIRNGQRSLQDP